MAKYIHVAFNFGSAPRKSDEIKALFNKELDWYRYVSNCWVLWTEKDTEELYELIHAAVGNDVKFFVCELNIGNRQGWMLRDFWDWLQADKSSQE